MMNANASALRYWQETGYTTESVREFCRTLDTKALAALVGFDAGKASVTVSSKTWNMQQGHYPTVADFMGAICRHPRLQDRKGCFVVWLEDGVWEGGEEVSRHAPLLAFGRPIVDCTTFLIPDPAYLGSLGYAKELRQSAEITSQTPWDARVPTLYWRGAASGAAMDTDTWRHSARARLVLASEAIANQLTIDAKFTRTDHLSAERQEELDRLNLVGPRQPFEEFLKYRYLLDVDGESCAWASFFLKLASGSTTLKVQSNLEQWYYRDLLPWKHFVPLDPSLQVLPDILQWLENHQDAARRIAQAGYDFVRELTMDRCVDETADLLAAILDCQRG